MKFRKRVLIFPIIMVACLVAVIYVANATPQKTEVTAKMPVEETEEPKLKYPYSVDQIKAEVTEAVVEETTPEPTPTPTSTPTPEPTPEPVVEEQTEPIVEEVVEVVEIELIEEVYDSDFEGAVETGNYYEDLPDETSEVWQYEETETQDVGMQYVGDWYVTFYSADLTSYGSANGYGSVPWVTCAAGYDIPFGTLVYVGDPINMTFEVRDRGVPSGSLDIFVSTAGEIPGWGAAYIPCYIVAWGDGKTAWGYE